MGFQLIRLEGEAAGFVRRSFTIYDDFLKVSLEIFVNNVYNKISYYHFPIEDDAEGEM